MDKPETALFALQEENGRMTSDVAAVADAVDEHNFILPQDRIGFTLCSLQTMRKYGFRTGVPVGSIEFVEACLGQQMRGIYIPEQLCREEYIHRHVAIVFSYEELQSLFDKWQADKLFVKSASQLKCEYADIYQKGRDIPADTKYFVSELIPILSEWRLFVYQHKILDTRCYSGNPFLAPNESVANKMVQDYSDCPPAYTLDLAILRDGSLAIMEVHPFISCGLYGFSSSHLLPMLIRAYNWEQNQLQKR